ncbi:beta-glucuronidase [Garciella nitratireducens]|uniref:Beta-glucuronidase n=1 Tax=Garciella nitratireducens DSM 15102 TaxID=1121911 RepID=A0A1T4P3A1_9FIRM|nr:beta-glucuronidase [Garciella nitratireducens]SJZ85984.1 beta-glucuronidase [Garciella nitratireducens DSM 15102]
MLYPIMTESRNLTDLSGVWKFYLDDETKKVDVTKPLETNEIMAVPGSFNDQAVFSKIRNHAGTVWYERNFSIHKKLLDQRIVLRFGSVTHKAVVYINGKYVAEHQGGFTPFEVEINDFIISEKNRITVAVNNILDHTTLPVGNYIERKNEEGKIIRKVDENFDFFNYAGIHRPVKIYTTPKEYIKDIIITYDVEGNRARIYTDVKTIGDFDQVKVTILDKEWKEVSYSVGEKTENVVENLKFWQPMNAYLYTARVETYKDGELVDIYEEPFGIRTIEVKKGKFLINGKPFYFKGFGKHEDTYINGRGLNEAANVLDLNLFKWIGANSFRTSHYPYSEEMMRLADQQGIVVIDEVPAVGLYEGFGFNFNIEEEKANTWDRMGTKEAHEQVIKELIDRDKNYACVVMWSIANEPASHEKGAYEYFKPLVKLVKDLDPQKRPTTIVNIMMATPDKDLVYNLIDVISLNRYYGWYVQTGDLKAAEEALRKELKEWEKICPNKPIVFTELGADTISGFHAIDDIPFTEEYQVRYYQTNHKVFDEFKNVVGEQVWNFADFETKVGIQRVQGNKKGIFNRAREPKMISHVMRKRWINIPNFDYKK